MTTSPQANQTTNQTKLNVLFLCTGNACRSQMAEGFAKHFLSDVINAYSAGVEPHGMNLSAMHVMTEAGVPIDSHHSKHINVLAEVAMDVVITVCGHADEACPAMPGNVRRIHHGFDDPPKLAAAAGTPELALDQYRKVRDQIRKYIHTQLLKDLNLFNAKDSQAKTH